MTAFVRQRRKGDTLLSSLRADLGVTSFHVTYLDPALFSALILLDRVRAAEIKVGNHSGTWAQPLHADLGIGDDTEAQEVRRSLLSLISNDFARFIESPTPAALADDATLWWAFAELIDHGKMSFAAGRYRGYGGAATLCGELARRTRAQTVTPTFGLARSEATPEIHCDLRTALRTIQNAIRILKHPWPEDELISVRKELHGLISNQLEVAQLYPHTSARGKARHPPHAYFSGLGLEVASQLLLQFRLTPSGAAPNAVGPNATKTMWTEWAPLAYHAKALGMDYRTFKKRAEGSWQLQSDPKRGHRFDKSLMSALERSRYDAAFQFPRRSGARSPHT